jgi:hypothetical protein
MFLPENKSARPTRQKPPGQNQLLWFSLMIAVGSFLPWVSTNFGNISGATGMGAGYWTFIAAALGLAGGLMPWRRVAITHAWIVAAVATILPVWQVLHLYSLVGFSGWMPGIGLVLVFFGGIFCAKAARMMMSYDLAPAGSPVAA